MLATCGSKTRRGVRAKKNAVCVARMLTAGGIPLAISNVPEMCLWVENGNHLYGRTNNPYDLHRFVMHRYIGITYSGWKSPSNVI